jgi:hypothetical protein
VGGLREVPVIVKDAYYEAEESQALWYPREAILEVDLGPQAHIPRLHAAVMAVNVEQVVFGLSAQKEVVTLEVIGARFDTSEELVLAVPERRGNIRIAPDRWGAEAGAATRHEGMTFDRGRMPLQLTASADHALFRVGLSGRVAARRVAASPHLVYGVADGFLCEFWVVNPTPSRME